MKKKISVVLMVILSLSFGLTAQDQVFSRQDTLRGSITPERAWWDLTYYHLSISVSPDDRSFTGSNLIGNRVIEPYQLMQIDLQPPMKIYRVTRNGIEHQSSVTYGNGFRNGYGGRDVSSTGYGLKFDFILVHESGHEWFANNITNWDVGDMWIHESFIAYSENLFVDYFWGKEASAAYCRGTRLNISNDRPIIGKYNVNHQGSGDMYAKGANMLHTLRQIIDNDQEWRQILRGLNEEFYHQTVKSEQIQNYIIEKTGIDLMPFFDQYLRDTRIPTFEYALLDGKMRYRWGSCVDGFQMPLKVYINGKKHWIQPIQKWQDMNPEEPIRTIDIDPDFYVAVFPLSTINQ